MRTSFIATAGAILIATVLADDDLQTHPASLTDRMDTMCYHCGPRAYYGEYGVNKLACVYEAAHQCNIPSIGRPFCGECASIGDFGQIPDRELNACVDAAHDYCSSEHGVTLHTWRIKNPSKCSATCGDDNVGLYTVDAVCVMDSVNVVDDDKCDPRTKPETVHACNGREKCGKKPKFSLVAGPWDDCSSTCGAGVQQRERHCLNRKGKDTYGSKCGKKKKWNKIDTTQECNTESCEDGFLLEYSPWSDCSGACTSKRGIVPTSTRTVKCYYKDGDLYTLHDDLEDCEDAVVEVGPLTQPCNAHSKCSFKKPRGFFDEVNATNASVVGVGLLAVGTVLVAGGAIKRRRRKEAEREQLMMTEEGEKNAAEAS